jgi:hypothetical protein
LLPVAAAPSQAGVDSSQLHTGPLVGTASSVFIPKKEYNSVMEMYADYRKIKDLDARHGKSWRRKPNWSDHITKRLSRLNTIFKHVEILKQQRGLTDEFQALHIMDWLFQNHGQ